LQQQTHWLVTKHCLWLLAVWGATVRALQDAEPQVISVTTPHTQTRDILETARFYGSHFIVETFGKPMAASVGVEQYRQLLEMAQERLASVTET